MRSGPFVLFVVFMLFLFRLLESPLRVGVPDASAIHPNAIGGGGYAMDSGRRINPPELLRIPMLSVSARESARRAPNTVTPGGIRVSSLLGRRCRGGNAVNVRLHERMVNDRRTRTGWRRNVHSALTFPKRRTDANVYPGICIGPRARRELSSASRTATLQRG